jgi:hypothetical protein
LAGKVQPQDRPLSPRREVDVKAMITHHRLGLTKCRLRAISLDDAFVEVKDFDIAVGADVDLVLKVRTGQSRGHCRLPANILRVEADGVDIKFHDLDDRAYHVLFDIVHVDH